MGGGTIGTRRCGIEYCGGGSCCGGRILTTLLLVGGCGTTSDVDFNLSPPFSSLILLALLLDILLSLIVNEQ